MVFFCIVLLEGLEILPMISGNSKSSSKKGIDM